ncbi:hypothetical protein ACIQYS_09000 [Psychrobacillus sp. NPDC096426]|uniref:hypothetical protein n=1 Tax=Psychrobacillus sp. NPDC096426 TaxID=3364491 RepID=UPI00381E4A81
MLLLVTRLGLRTSDIHNIKGYTNSSEKVCGVMVNPLSISISFYFYQYHVEFWKQYRKNGHLFMEEAF